MGLLAPSAFSWSSFVFSFSTASFSFDFSNSGSGNEWRCSGRTTITSTEMHSRPIILPWWTTSRSRSQCSLTLLLKRYHFRFLSNLDVYASRYNAPMKLFISTKLFVIFMSPSNLKFQYCLRIISGGLVTVILISARNQLKRYLRVIFGLYKIGWPFT